MLTTLQAHFGSRFPDTAARDRYHQKLLRPLVRHAFAQVPHYRQQLTAAGFNAADLDAGVALEQLPILTRSDYQPAEITRFTAANYAAHRLRRYDTSGSSGVPLSVYRTAFEDRLLQSFRLRRLFQLGLRLRDRRAGLVFHYGRPEDLRYHSARLHFGALYRAPIHYGHAPEVALQQLRKIRPAVTAGYPGILSEIGALMSETDRARIPTRFIACGGELLTDAGRRQIEQAFGARVFNFYGAHETNMAASECPHTGLLHLSSESIIAEVLHEGRPVAVGEAGNLTLTALHSYAMPFVRYQLGDVVVRGPDPCPCGAPYPTLSAVQGRVTDAFRMPDGTTIHPFVIDGRLTDFVAAMRRYQIAQARPDLIEIRVVPQDDSLAGKARDIESRYEFLRPRGVRVQLKLVDELQTSSNGKFRLYVPFRGSVE